MRRVTHELRAAQAGPKRSQVRRHPSRSIQLIRRSAQMIEPPQGAEAQSRCAFVN